MGRGAAPTSANLLYGRRDDDGLLSAAPGPRAWTQAHALKERAAAGELDEVWALLARHHQQLGNAPALDSVLRMFAAAHVNYGPDRFGAHWFQVCSQEDIEAERDLLVDEAVRRLRETLPDGGHPVGKHFQISQPRDWGKFQFFQLVERPGPYALGLARALGSRTNTTGLSEGRARIARHLDDIDRYPAVQLHLRSTIEALVIDRDELLDWPLMATCDDHNAERHFRRLLSHMGIENSHSEDMVRRRSRTGRTHFRNPAERMTTLCGQQITTLNDWDGRVRRGEFAYAFAHQNSGDEMKAERAQIPCKQCVKKVERHHPELQHHLTEPADYPVFQGDEREQILAAGEQVYLRRIHDDDPQFGGRDIVAAANAKATELAIDRLLATDDTDGLARRLLEVRAFRWLEQQGSIPRIDREDVEDLVQDSGSAYSWTDKVSRPLFERLVAKAGLDLDAARATVDWYRR